MRSGTSCSKLIWSCSLLQLRLLKRKSSSSAKIKMVVRWIMLLRMI